MIRLKEIPVLIARNPLQLALGAFCGMLVVQSIAMFQFYVVFGAFKLKFLIAPTVVGVLAGFSLTLILLIVRQREDQLRKAKEVSESANRTKSEFLANMSHELRTPLNSIIGFSQMLKDETFGPLGSDENREYVVFIQHSGEHLHRIIGDILDLSKVEAGEDVLSEEIVDIEEIIDECLEMISTRSDKKWLSFPVEISTEIPSLYVDRLKVIQILLNLLSNAIKFTPEGGEIRTRAQLNDQGSIQLIVKDTGVGISADELELVMEPFGQSGDTYTRSHDGSGLGLALVNSLMKLHGGRVKLESTPGKGTSVSMTFPPERTVDS